MSRVHLHSLPPEILLKTLAFSDPQSVSRWSQTCREAHEFSQSRALWRSLFEATFDPVAASSPAASSSTSTCPDDLESQEMERGDFDTGRENVSPYEFDFESAVKERIRARGWLRSYQSVATLQTSIPDLKRTLSALVDIAEQRLPFGSPVVSLNSQFLDTHLSQPHISVHSFLPSSVPYEAGGHRLRPRGEKVSLTEETADAFQLASKLHVLHTPTEQALQSEKIRTSAREIVYERENFQAECEWGPFKPLRELPPSTHRQGFFKKGKKTSTLEVDWRKIEALAVVQGCNLREAMGNGWARSANAGSHGLEDDYLPSGWDSTRPAETKDFGRDWAGVEQSFHGTYAFLDYQSFAHYNFHRTDSHRPSLEDETEAVGDCMKLDLTLLPEGEEVRPLDMDLQRSLHPGADDTDDEVNDEDFVMTSDEGDDAMGGSDSGSSESGSDSDVSDVSDSAFNPIASSSQRTVEDEEPSPPTSEMGTPPTDSPASFTSGAQLHVTSADSTGKGKGESEAKTDSTVNQRHLSFVGSSKTDSTVIQRRLSFVGTSKPLHFSGSFANNRMPNRSIRGTVEMTDEGHVHWQYVIRYGGADQWKMHGVQVGGVRSKFGVLGVWSCADSRDEAGPNGPFWYWPKD